MADWSDLIVPFLIPSLVGCVTFALAFFPVLHHLIYGVPERRREILGLFDAASTRLYFGQFYYAEIRNLQGSDPVEYLRDFYDGRFGRHTFYLPLSIFILTLVLTVVVMVFRLLNIETGIGTPLTNLNNTSMYALAGAYLYVTSDLLTRYRQRDIVPSIVYWSSFRFLISIPLAASVTFFLRDVDIAGNMAAAIAFSLGVFPTSTLFLVLRRKVSPKLGLTEDVADPNKIELESIFGINTGIAEKFADVGITTLLQLAYEDPILLAMRTNLSLNFIVDVVSQALLVVYMPDRGAAARKLGLRGAIEADEIFEALQRPPPDRDQERAKVIVGELAKELNVPQEIAEEIVHDLWADPYTKFLRDIWYNQDEQVRR
jgi:hypothetical protein